MMVQEVKYRALRFYFAAQIAENVFIVKCMKTIENLMQVLGCHFVIVFLMVVP